MIGSTRIGGFRRRHERSSDVVPRAAPASEQIVHLNRLEHDLQRACERYERAIAALDAGSTELERRAQTEAILDEAMREPASTSSVAAGERIRLAEASFDQLRGLGLSVTQAKRVVALRDQGALTSTGDLDEVPGLPSVVVTELRQRLRD